MNKTKSEKGFAQIILLVLGIILGAGVVLVFFLLGKENHPSSNASVFAPDIPYATSPSPSIQTTYTLPYVSPLMASSSGSLVNTYNSNEFGFQFSNTSGWTQTTPLPEQVVTFSDGINPTQINVGAIDLSKVPAGYTEVQLAAITCSDTSQLLKEKVLKNPNLIVNEISINGTITINGTKGHKCIYEIKLSQDTNGELTLSFNAYYFQGKKYGYTITTYYLKTNQVEAQKVQQILNSFSIN